MAGTPWTYIEISACALVLRDLAYNLSFCAPCKIVAEDFVARTICNRTGDTIVCFPKSNVSRIARRARCSLASVNYTLEERSNSPQRSWRRFANCGSVHRRFTVPDGSGSQRFMVLHRFSSWTWSSKSYVRKENQKEPIKRRGGRSLEPPPPPFCFHTFDLIFYVTL